MQDPSLLKEGEKQASTTIMDSSVLCAVHTGWFPQTRHSRPARCGVGVCPCTHGNRRPVNCFYLLLGSTTQMHLAGLGVATSDAQRSCFHGNHIGFLLISGLSSILLGAQLSSAHPMHPVCQIRKRRTHRHRVLNEAPVPPLEQEPSAEPVQVKISVWSKHNDYHTH